VGVLKLVELLLVESALLFKEISVFLFEVDTDFVVNERDDHTILERDQIGGLVLNHLGVTLHEDEGSIGGKLVFALLSNAPSLFRGVRQVAMVGRHCLQLDLDLTLHGATNGEVVLGKSFKNDFLLDKVLIFVAGDPSRAGAKSWGIRRVSLLNSVFGVGGAEDLESLTGLLGRGLLVSYLVEMVMNNLTEINESILLDLDFSCLVNLYAGSVDHTQVAHKVLAIAANDHKLGLPQLLVVRNLVVVSLAFTKLKDTTGAIKAD
jgi:hypothetical protein